jgi:hypothetical protein
MHDNPLVPNAIERPVERAVTDRGPSVTVLASSIVLVSMTAQAIVEASRIVLRTSRADVPPRERQVSIDHLWTTGRATGLEPRIARQSLRAK